MKYYNTQIVFQEFPGEVTLAINISGCPNQCPDCHSKYLWNDVGEELNWDTLKNLIEKNSGITCVGFMGGDQDPLLIKYLAQKIRMEYTLRIGWYTGIGHALTMREMDFVKIGKYNSSYGGLDCPITNQIYLERQPDGDWRDATDKFWRSPKFVNPSDSELQKLSK